MKCQLRIRLRNINIFIYKVEDLIEYTKRILEGKEFNKRCIFEDAFESVTLIILNIILNLDLRVINIDIIVSIELRIISIYSKQSKSFNYFYFS